MSQFKIFTGLGFDHIIDIKGYDHLLFIIVLCAVYSIKDWKKILILVTSFTIGHSITLALATLKFIHIDTRLVEFLIPITIFITAISNLFVGGRVIPKRSWNYFLATFFGLIHGLGFSSYLRSLLGKESSIISELFALNIGLELGQIIIVAIYLLFASAITSIFHIQRRTWNLIISSMIAGIAITMIIENNYW